MRLLYITILVAPLITANELPVPVPGPVHGGHPSVIHSLPLLGHPHPTPYAPGSPYGPYSPTPLPYVPHGHASPLKESAVFRNPYEQPGPQELEDALRTQDADLTIAGHLASAYSGHLSPIHLAGHPLPEGPELPVGPVIGAEPHHQIAITPHGVASPHHAAVLPHGAEFPVHPAPAPHVPAHHVAVAPLGPPHHGPVVPHPTLAPHPVIDHHAPVIAPHHAPVHHHLQEYHPYQYDISKIPECAYTNQHYYNLTFCLQDDYYPVDTIKHELERNMPLVDRILSDITYQSADNLVDGLTKAEEEGYTYQHYYGSKKHQTYTADYQGYTYEKEYYKEGGYLCPSDIYYGRPKRAMNTYNKWKVIVNLPDEYYAKGYGIGYEKYTQTQRLEQCMYPGAPCSFIDHAYHSGCLQKHNFVRLLAYTYEEGLHIDSFKLPIACSCHVKQPRHYGPTAGYGYSPAPGYAHSPTPVPFHHPTPDPYGKK